MKQKKKKGKPSYSKWKKKPKKQLKNTTLKFSPRKKAIKAFTDESFLFD